MEKTATSSAHTAEPWKMDCYDDYIVIYGSDNTRILDIYAAPSVAKDAEGRSNAHLVVAAPELLEYCKMLLDDCEQMADDPTIGYPWDWSLTASNLRKVIAKAEGYSKII